MPIALVAAMMGTAACRPPDTSVRGFDARQISSGRDDGVRMTSFNPDGTALYRARKLSDVAVPDGTAPPVDLSRFDIETGAETLIATGVLKIVPLPARLPATAGDPRSLALLHFATAADIPPVLVPSMLPPLVLTLFDEMTTGAVDVDQVDGTNLQLGDTRSDPILVARFVSDRMSVPFVGAPGQLVPLPIHYNQLVGRDRAGMIALTGSDDHATQRFSRFPFDGSEPVTVVPGVLADHLVVPGDNLEAGTPPPVLPSNGVSPRLICGALPPPVPTPASSTVPDRAVVSSGLPAPAATPPVGRGRATTPPAADPPPPGPPACLLFYDRVWPDATTRGFVQVLDGSAELQLPGVLVGHLADVVQVAPDGGGALWSTVSSAKQTRVFAWRTGTAQAGSCVVGLSPAVATFKVNAWRPRQAQFAAAAQPSSQPKGQSASWTLIAGTAGSECHVIATGDNLIKQILYSPGGTYLAFFVADPAGASQLYVTHADNPAPRLIAEGKSFAAIDFHDEKHLLLWRWSIDGYSVAWVDPESPGSPSIDHGIADGAVWDARASWAWLNDHTVLLADAAAAADQSCSLRVVDIDSGYAQLVSRGVVDFTVPWTERPVNARELTVPFVTRSRVESVQDGVWVARIPLDGY